MEIKSNLLDMTIEELQKTMTDMGHAKFRGKQVFKWLARGVGEIDEMTDLSKSLRDEMKNNFYINECIFQ